LMSPSSQTKMSTAAAMVSLASAADLLALPISGARFQLRSSGICATTGPLERQALPRAEAEATRVYRVSLLQVEWRTCAWLVLAGAVIRRLTYREFPSHRPALGKIVAKVTAGRDFASANARVAYGPRDGNALAERRQALPLIRSDRRAETRCRDLPSAPCARGLDRKRSCRRRERVSLSSAAHRDPTAWLGI
jgi:hypothetical protein